MWIAGGASWFFGHAPEHWNPWTQLIRAGFAGSVLAEFRGVHFRTDAVAEYTEPLIYPNFLLANEEYYPAQIAA